MLYTGLTWTLISKVSLSLKHVKMIDKIEQRKKSNFLAELERKLTCARNNREPRAATIRNSNL
jgi:hypothetical protein